MRDYTTFLKLDLNGRFTIVANKITVNALTRNESAYVYEPGHSFDGDFTHNLDAQVGAVVIVAGVALFGLWAIANDVDDIVGLQNADKSFLHLQSLKSITNEQVYLIERDDATNYSDFTNLTYGAKYYYTVERVEAASPFGTLYGTPFTDVNRTIPFDVLVQPLHTSKKDYSIVYGVISYNNGSGTSVSAVIENLDLVNNKIVVGIATAENNGNNSIDVIMPYTNDDNANSTYTIDYKLSSDNIWINWVAEAPNTPSPYINTIQNLIGGNLYDVRATYLDSEGVTGDNPQIISGIFIPFTLIDTKITTHNQDAKNRLLEQYKGKAGIEGLIESYSGNQIQDLEDALFPFYDRLNIEISEGVQLNGIGDIVDQDRLGLSDIIYRLFIRARIGANVSEGDIERLIEVWKLITQANVVKLEEIYPAEVNLATDVALPDELIDFAYALIQEVSAGGVGVGITTFLPEDAFAFDGANPAITKGFGDVKEQGITTSTSVFKLIDNTALFQTKGIDNTMLVMNDTDGTQANILSVDSEIQLTLDADIFIVGEDYYINANTGGKLAKIQGAN